MMQQEEKVERCSDIIDNEQLGPSTRRAQGLTPRSGTYPNNLPHSKTAKYNVIIGLGKENNNSRPPERRQFAVDLLVFENNSRDLILEGY